MSCERTKYPCPCCGFLTFDEEPGSYGICPVCDWEDDEVQLRHPNMPGGANHYSLWQGQQRILQHYSVSVGEAKGYLRDPEWRPLKPDELITESVPQTGRAYFDALGAEPPSYYWLQENQDKRT